LDKAGEQLLERCAPETKKFISKWLKLLSKPSFVKAFRSKYGCAPTTFSNTRWWSRFDVIRELWKNRKSLRDFVVELINQKVCEKSAKKLLQYYTADSWQFHIDLAFLLDAGLPFYDATYALEGDSFLAPFVTSKLRALNNMINGWTTVAVTERVKLVAHERYPIIAVPLNPDPNKQRRNAWIAETLNKAIPCFAYFTDTIIKVDAEMEGERKYFEAAELWHPGTSRARYMFGQTIDLRAALGGIKFLESEPETVNQLIEEWPKYVDFVKEENVPRDLTPQQVIDFWNAHATALPVMYAVARKLILGQPSSAAAERVFSVLATSFSETQLSSLQDLIELVVMIKYNDSQRRHLE
jgi:hypothetical protein